MNLNDLQTSVRFKSNITNTAIISDAQITTELNQGYYELFKSIVDVNEDFFEEQNTKFDLGQNSSLYSLPTDLVKFKQLRVAYSTPSGLEDYKVCRSYDPSEVGNVALDEENVPASTPIVDVTNNYMRIKPTPSSVVTDGGIIYYIARPSALVNSADTPVIPTEYHDLMAIFGAYRVSEKFENFNVADRYRQQFLQGIEDMKRKLAAREINRHFRFRDPREIHQSNRAELPN